MRFTPRSSAFGTGRGSIGRSGAALPPALSPRDLDALHAYFDRAKRRSGASRWTRVKEMFAGRAEPEPTEPTTR